MQQFFPFAGDLKTISPLSLAYVGDGVYELMIRERLIGTGNCPPKKLHTAAVALAKASAQAAAAARIFPLLTEEERTIFRRGRNAHPARRVPQNASVEEYHQATALECLFGWLYLKGDGERLRALFEKAVKEEAQT